MPITRLDKPKKPSFKTGDNYWVELIGSRTDFSLESRIFHSISISLIVIVTLYVPFNIFTGLYAAALSSFLVCLFFTYQYYKSRFLGKSHSNIAFGLIGILLFGVNYFLTAGIDGSTDLIWPVYLLFLLSITPYRQHFVWVILYLLFFLGIHLIGFQYPYLIQHPFTAGKGQLIDRLIVIPIPVIVIYVIITFIRESYDKEKKETDKKTQAVEASKEQILLQKEQLEQSNIEKNKLMSIISHDLRSPLISIQNYLELLKEYDLESSEREGMEKSLLTSTNHAIVMLSNLLSWSKSQMEGASVHIMPLNLLQVLSNTLEMEKILAAKKEISFSYQIPSNIVIMADVDMLQLVIRNLVSNAIKFTLKGGEISINAELTGYECKITVKDNGKGISEEKKANIFTIKSQPEYGTNNEKGVGLGLALCKEFTELQGGRIAYESMEGEGSSFFVFLPSVKS